MDAKLRRAVYERARGRCEYCRLVEGTVNEAFVTDHIIASQHLGPSSLNNLAFSCARCNRHKGPNVAGVDQSNGQIVPLFNPRTDVWTDHFAWSEGILVGRTATGRVTVHVLALNEPRVVERRLLLIRLGLFQPGDS
jgi:hypothetical protein